MASKRDSQFGPGEPHQPSSSLHVRQLGDTTASATGYCIDQVMDRLQGGHRRKLSEIYGPHVHEHQDYHRTSVTFEADAKRQRSIIRDTEHDYSELGSGTVTAPLNFSLEHLDHFRASYKLSGPMVDRFLKLFQYDGPKRSVYSGSRNHISIARKMQPHDASEEIVKEMKSSQATFKPSPWNRCW